MNVWADSLRDHAKLERFSRPSASYGVNGQSMLSRSWASASCAAALAIRSSQRRCSASSVTSLSEIDACVAVFGSPAIMARSVVAILSAGEFCSQSAAMWLWMGFISRHRFLLRYRGGAVGADQFGGQMLAGLHGQHAVGDSIRQDVRPLVHRLIGDADCAGGCGDGAAKQLDGFGFLHARI